ncbi:MAG: ribosome-associated translation inhibitor RaiA [Oscillospiraceae bacterium]|nr:ribosome-associated translation inhibitor RaiA [Oscillospiraceae bacterium]
MNITITGRKINLRDSFKERATKKLDKFTKIFGADADASVTVSLEKNRITVEITVHSKGYVYRAEQTSMDLDESLDLAIDHLARQMRKNKTKLDRRNRIDPKLRPLDIDAIDSGEDASEIEEETDFQIVRSKRFAVKPMTIDEAVLQMNMLGHEFFLFRNEMTGEINVVYRRRNGNYGLLEPQA